MPALLKIVDDGGPVAVALFALSFALWWVVYMRWRALGPSTLRRRQAEAAALLDRLRPPGAGSPVARQEDRRLDILRSQLNEQLRAWRGVLRTLAAVAPMLGLLGTVGGMIETFSTLHVSGLAHADASVAGGISTALVTTQLGLLAGVPGIIAARWLERLEARRRSELIQVLGVAPAGALS